jgi:hypothetical protein
MAYNFLQLQEVVDFEAQKSASTELDAKHKAPNLHFTPPDAKPVLPAVLFCKCNVIPSVI